MTGNLSQESPRSKAPALSAGISTRYVAPCPRAREDHSHEQSSTASVYITGVDSKGCKKKLSSQYDTPYGCDTPRRPTRQSGFISSTTQRCPLRLRPGVRPWSTHATAITFRGKPDAAEGSRRRPGRVYGPSRNIARTAAQLGDCGVPWLEVPHGIATQGRSSSSLVRGSFPATPVTALHAMLNNTTASIPAVPHQAWII